MAIIVFHDRQSRELHREQALKLWEGLQHPESLDASQLAYLKSIKRLYLNWHTAPDSYIKSYLDEIIPQALHDWAVDIHGRPTRPATPQAWAFAKRWGLWSRNRPTELVTNYPKQRMMALA